MPKPIPVPSFIPNISQSMYQVSTMDSTVPPATAIVGSKGIGIIGCNSWAVLAQTGPSNSFKLLSKNNLTSTTCPTDNDSNILSALDQIDGYTILKNNFNLTQNGKPIL